MSIREKPVEQVGIQQYVRPVAFSVLAGAVACMIVLLIFSFVLSTQNIPQSLVDPMATVSICVGAFVSGLVCGKIIHRKGLVCGLVCGIALSFVLLLASLGISDGGFGIPALFKIVFILLFAMLGGVLGINTRKRRSAKR